MKKINLSSTEGIMLRSEYVLRYLENDDYDEIDEMYLTNENIILVYEKKTEDVIEKISLSKIKIVNNKVQIFKVDDDDYDLGLQIHYVDGNIEHYVFDKKKELDEWYCNIIELLTGEKIEEDKKQNKSFFHSFIDSTKDAVSNVKNKLEDGIEKNSNEKTYNEKDEENNKKKEENKQLSNSVEESKSIKAKEIEEKKDQNIDIIKCSNCGEKIPINSRFCNYCGKDLGECKNIEKDHKTSERTFVYEGKIHKCPNCGETLKSFEQNCSACGYEIRESKNSSSIQILSEKIEEIEKTRKDTVNNKKSIFDPERFNPNPITKTDEQIISLIKNYPIPNTKEDLYEFLIVSSSNIDVSAYADSSIKNYTTAKMALSDAWKAKFEQAYQKAKIVLKNDNRLNEFEQKYSDINKSIKKSKNKTWILMGIIYGIIFLVGIIALLFGSVFKKTDDKNVSSNNEIIKKNNEDKENIEVNNYSYDALKVKNFIFSIPNYYDEEGSKENYRQFYAEKGTKVSMLSISYPKESDDEYDVSFKGLEEDNENMKKSIKSLFSKAEVYDDYVFESDYGIKGMVYKFNFELELNALEKYDARGTMFCFPSEEDRRWFYVTITETTNIGTNKYKDDFMKIIKSVKKDLD